MISPGALVASVILTGHLTVESLDSALRPVRDALRTSPDARFCLIVDARRMTDYDGAARARFVEFNRSSRDRIRRVAVITDNKLWMMVVAAMALASSQKLKAFETQPEALRWFEERD